MKKTNTDMLNGSITGGLLSMTIPVMIMLVMQSLLNMVDMTVLRYFSDDSAVGSVGACGTLMVLCTNLLIGISAGTNVVIAKRIGLGDKDRVNKVAETSILFSVISGILLMIVGVLFAKTFLQMTNCPESLLSRAVVYFKMYFLGVPFLLIYSFCTAILRAMGDTKTQMYFSILGGLIKVVLSIIFITAFNVDVEGVGFSTVFSNIIIAALAMRSVLKSDAVHINLKKLRFYASELKEILFIGIPTGVQSSLYSLANVVITTAVNGFGADATTGIAIANQFDGMLYNIIYAPSLATIPYVSQNVGAGKIDRVKKAVIRSVLITIAFGATFGALSAIFSAQLSSIMSSTPAVIKYSQQKMIIVSSTYFICGINEIMGGVLRGMGKPILPTVSTLIFMCILRFAWVYLIFPLCPNLTFLYLVWPIGWILSIITLLIAYFPAISVLQKEKEMVLSI